LQRKQTKECFRESYHSSISFVFSSMGIVGEYSNGW